MGHGPSDGGEGYLEEPHDGEQSKSKPVGMDSKYAFGNDLGENKQDRGDDQRGHEIGSQSRIGLGKEGLNGHGDGYGADDDGYIRADEQGGQQEVRAFDAFQ